MSIQRRLILAIGGVLGLVEHRGDPEVWQDPQALSGYVNQDYAVELIESVGFRLEAASEVKSDFTLATCAHFREEVVCVSESNVKTTVGSECSTCVEVELIAVDT